MRIPLAGLMLLCGCGGTEPLPAMRDPRFMAGTWKANYLTISLVMGAEGVAPISVTGTFQFNDAGFTCAGTLAGTAESNGVVLHMAPAAHTLVLCDSVLDLSISTPPRVPDAPPVGQILAGDRLVQGTLVFVRQ